MHKGSVRVIPVDLANFKLERRALLLRHKDLPEPRKDFKEFASSYLINLAKADLADDTRRLKEEDRAIEVEHSDKLLAKFDQADIEAFLARKKAESPSDDDE